MAATTFNKTELAAIAALAAPLLNPARLLYRQDFTKVVLGTVGANGAWWPTGAWQDFEGAQPMMRGGLPRLLLLTDPLTIASPAEIASIMSFAIEPTAGPKGGPALKQSILRSANGAAPMGWAATQSAFQFLPLHEEPSLYVSLWLKLQADMVQRLDDSLTNVATAWRVLTEFKTGTATAGHTGNDGDYRLQLAIHETEKGKPFVTLLGDNQAGLYPYEKRVEYFLQENRIAVPVDQWFQIEQCWERSSEPWGRVRVAINRQQIFDRWGPNMGDVRLPINRLYWPPLYTSGSYPAQQWIGPIEVWDRPPSTASFAL